LSTHIQSNPVQSSFKDTRDMFDSDYFGNRIENNLPEKTVQKKSAIRRKDTNGSSRLQ
jgi:hypothetical protein